MKLKTLKDLNKETQKKVDELKQCPSSVFLQAQILGRNHLRTEAIKWVKLAKINKVEDLPTALPHWGEIAFLPN